MVKVTSADRGSCLNPQMIAYQCKLRLPDKAGSHAGIGGGWRNELQLDLSTSIANR